MIQQLRKLPGAVMTNWFCRRHPHEFLIFTYSIGKTRSNCRACERERVRVSIERKKPPTP